MPVLLYFLYFLSSYLVTSGLSHCSAWFDREWMLASFGKKEKTAIRHYVQFVADGVQQSSLWLQLKNQIYLGSDDFVGQVQKNIEGKALPEYLRFKRDMY